MPGMRYIGWVLFIGVALILFLALQKGQTQYARIPLSHFDYLLKADKVAVLTLDGDKILGELRQPEPIGPRGEQIAKFQSTIPQSTGESWAFISWVLDHRGTASVTVENNSNLVLNLVLPLIPWVLIFLFIWFFVFRQLRGATQRAKDPVQVVVVNPPDQPPPTPTSH